MTKKLLLVTTILLVVAFGVFAADVTGKWTYETAGRHGGHGPVYHPQPEGRRKQADRHGVRRDGRSRGGGGGAPADVKSPTARSMETTSPSRSRRTTQNGDFVTKYEGTLAGDELKLKVTRPGFNGGDPTRRSDRQAVHYVGSPRFRGGFTGPKRSRPTPDFATQPTLHLVANIKKKKPCAIR